MTGKEKCEYLKGIRKRMAEAYNIPYEPKECTHESDCNGTCPYCEREAVELMEKIRLKESGFKEITCLEETDDDASYVNSCVRMGAASLLSYQPLSDEKNKQFETLLRLLTEESKTMGIIDCHHENDDEIREVRELLRKAIEDEEKKRSEI